MIMSILLLLPPQGCSFIAISSPFDHIASPFFWIPSSSFRCCSSFFFFLRSQRSPPHQCQPHTQTPFLLTAEPRKKKNPRYDNNEKSNHLHHPAQRDPAHLLRGDFAGSRRSLNPLAVTGCCDLCGNAKVLGSLIGRRGDKFRIRSS